MEVGMPACWRKVAEEYFSVRWLLSRITCTLTPRSWAATSALAMGAEVKLYAWTSTLALAACNSSTTASVQPPSGEKWTASDDGLATCSRGAARESKQRAATISTLG